MLNDGAIEYEHGTPATEAQVGPFAFPVQKVHKIIVLDMRMANADRHTGNILMSRGEDEQIFLIQIDQGLKQIAICNDRLKMREFNFASVTLRSDQFCLKTMVMQQSA
ncbi:hypothetical protein CQW23_19561 [Capsicum baccatum]|uniref:1-phosphatidylinositol 4-kinase n=1 Tax=Capsicum baccatum TaxID=33114 RepID=A0A2G2W654_CAPBA|nr:hypothetical protein CQW23_19561 [Capsicum baccatum]